MQMIVDVAANVRRECRCECGGEFQCMIAVRVRTQVYWNVVVECRCG